MTTRQEDNNLTVCTVKTFSCTQSARADTMRQEESFIIYYV